MDGRKVGRLLLGVKLGARVGSLEGVEEGFSVKSEVGKEGCELAGRTFVLGDSESIEVSVETKVGVSETTPFNDGDEDPSLIVGERLGKLEFSTIDGLILSEPVGSTEGKGVTEITVLFST
mmetsp:Transcript_1735/g.2634  ORF Transcript_1735/g.2634 Transcript_1735/m.2634 type:complete len:121 (-) Transcript_1735:1772-2134(-)